MEQQKMKRARQGDDETQKEWFEHDNNAKRRDVCGMKLMKDVEKEKEKEGWSSEARESQLALGVFDFPWLKDGVTSKSEGYFLDFEDNFSSLFEQEDVSSKASSVDLSNAYGLFETPEAKLEDIAWQPFESDMVEHEVEEDVDCIWSSLLKHPL
ncbi:unnamed protein product [Sphenostylis stenocarpa]|uniref:Uncharacterized protein n=1 Tax=Sphenostylis stenocarpa TaxID=92480 RepID=A0AA86S4N2_9FABA|nr:unnamed protein product [Sphenostylis stenocarpa]